MQKNYVQNKNKLDTLQQRSVQFVEAAMEGIKQVVKSTNDDDGYDDYVISMKQRLMYVPSEHLLECINGIFNIIDNYILNNEEA